MLVTLPFVMLLLDCWPLKRAADGREKLPESRRLVREKWPFFLLAAISCVVTYLAQREQAVVSLQEYPVGLRLENVVVSYADYILKTIWPANLAVFYPLPACFPAYKIALAALLLSAVSICAWRWRRQVPYLLIGWLWFLGTLVPVIGLVHAPGASQAMADRYTYFPAVGLFVTWLPLG